MVRMLMREDLDHEGVCVAARDRIGKLSHELATVRRALTVALANQTCRYHFVDEPEGTTCWTKHLQAKSGEGQMTPEWRAKLASGSQLCDFCQLVAKLLPYTVQEFAASPVQQPVTVGGHRIDTNE